MRGVLVAACSLLALAAPSLASPEPPDWTPWSEDPRDLPPPAPADIASIDVGVTPSHLHLRFASHEAPQPAPFVSSDVSFVAVQERSPTVRFVWVGTPRLFVGGEEATEGWSVAEGSGPTSWHLQVEWPRLSLVVGAPFALRDLDATATTGVAEGGAVYVGLWSDHATGPDLEFTPGVAGRLMVSVASLEAGVTIEGPDYGGGASVTVDGRGEPLVAYYIYDGERGTERGIYLARIGKVDGGLLDGASDGFVAQRIADTRVSREQGRDGQMRTQVAHDGTTTFVLFTDDPAVDNDEDGPGHPGTPDSVYVLVPEGDAWGREDPTPGGRSDVGPEDVADLVARDGRVVAAVPVGRDVWVVERKPQQWQEVTRLPGATSAKLALDSKGHIHVASVAYTDPEGSWRDGTLSYASSRDGFRPVPIGDDISSGWEGPETDGSFAIAVGPQDEVAILWNDGGARERSQEQRVAILADGEWTHDFAPLSPGHGNPQYTMRLGYTAHGHLVAASGYGGTDTLAVRGPNGGWIAQEMDRYDVWDMAVSPAGNVYFAYTQPHGGTTVALTAFAVSPALDSDAKARAVGEDASPKATPSLSAAASLALLGGAAVVACGRRR